MNVCEMDPQAVGEPDYRFAEPPHFCQRKLEAGRLRADLLKAIDNRLAHIVGVEKRICHRDVLGNTESRPWIEAQPSIPNDLRHIRHRDQQRRLEICRHDRRYLSYLARTARFPPDHLTPLPQSGVESLFSSE